jgi:dTDP-4-amino-4,6-dideoxygalactose transaminase
MSRIAGELVGSFGDAAFYSYEAAKPVFVGIGGSAIANNDALSTALAREYTAYEEPPTMAQLENEGMVHAYRIAYRPATYWAVRSVFRALSKAGVIRGNYNKVDDAVGPATDFARRMGSMQVRRLRRELRELGRQTDHRIRVADQYRTRIRGYAASHFKIAPGVEPVFGRYPMIAKDKKYLVESARDAHVELAVFYDTPVQPLSGERLRSVGYEPGSCPEAEYLAEHVVSLPTGRQVTPRVIDRAVKFLNEAVA